MPLTYFTEDMDIIQKLDDQPNDIGGLSADQLKAKFDEGGNKVKTYLNSSLLPELAGITAEEIDTMMEA